MSSSSGDSNSSTSTSYGAPDGHFGPACDGDRVGKYTLSQRIGRGQYGLIWSVHDSAEKVLKILRADEDAEEDVENEKRILERLRSTHVVALLDAFEHKTDEDVPHSVLVFARADHDLFHLLHDDGTVKMERSTMQRLIQQLLRAVDFLREKNVVHLDLKPENILLFHGDARLCDFGTARIMPSDAPEYGQTIEYRALEMILEDPVGFAADVWSIGCVVYEILTAAEGTRTATLFEPRDVVVEFDDEEADDVVDRTHLCLCVELFGPIPRHITRRSKHLFTMRGTVRGLSHPIDPTTSLWDLMRDDGLSAAAADAWSAFLRPFFEYSPRRRVQCLADVCGHELLTT